MPNGLWDSSVWVPVGIGLGLISLAATVFFAWWFARGPGLSMQVSGTTVISAPENVRISVLYDGEQVPRVTQSVVWLWRTGRGNVEGRQIVEEDPLVLSVPDGSHILDVTLLRQSKDTNRFTHSFERAESAVKSINLDFKYLDKGQGVAIEVYHTAAHPESIRIDGTIMGIPNGIKRTSSGSTMILPTTMAGSIALTIPSALIPWHLRGVGRDPRPLRDAVFGVLIESLRGIGFRL